MIKIIVNVLIILMLLESICNSVSNATPNKDAAAKGLDDFIRQRNGKVIWSGEGQKYHVEVNGRKALIDFSSEKNIKTSMSALFPNTIFIKFIFLKVIPNADIVIEKRKYGKTDKIGNFNNGNFLDTQPGSNHVQLVKDNKIMVETEILIAGENDVKCSGLSQMQCKQS